MAELKKAKPQDYVYMLEKKMHGAFLLPIKPESLKD